MKESFFGTRFVPASKLNDVKNVIKFFDLIIDSTLCEAILKSDVKFSHTDKTKEQVVDQIRKATSVMKYGAVYLRVYYSPWWNISQRRVVANTQFVAGTYEISFNTRNFNFKNTPSAVNTLVHEFLHVIGFSHGDNSPKGKEFSVPYFVGNLAEKIVLEEAVQYVL